jgi:hypothetical protein
VNFFLFALEILSHSEEGQASDLQGDIVRYDLAAAEWTKKVISFSSGHKGNYHFFLLSFRIFPLEMSQFPTLRTLISILSSWVCESCPLFQDFWVGLWRMDYEKPMRTG